MKTRFFVFLSLCLCAAASANKTPLKPPHTICEVATVPEHIDTLPPYAFNFSGDALRNVPASIMQSGFEFGTGQAGNTFAQIVLTFNYAYATYFSPATGTAFPNVVPWLAPSDVTASKTLLVLTAQKGSVLLGQQTVVGAPKLRATGLLQISPANMTDPALFYQTTFSIQVFTQPVYAAVQGQIQIRDSADAQMPVTFEFRSIFTGAIFTRTATLTAVSGRPDTGAFTFTDIPMSSYTVHIKGANTLATNIPVDTTLGNALNLAASLLAGDANNDNHVDVLDFGLLVNAYGSDMNVPGSGYDMNADFNNDCKVDVLDFGILVNNYGAVGAN